MKLVVVGGPPAAGKTSVLAHALGRLAEGGTSVAVVKLDCLAAADDRAYAARGIRCLTGLSNYVCPDHYLATNLDRIVAWGGRERLDLLVVESAGLCNRCSPHLQDVLAVTVLDMLGGVESPRKIGPLLRSADLVVLTRGDLVSQAEREVFRARVAGVNRGASILEVNGLTGQGTHRLADRLARAPGVPADDPLQLRFPMPAAVCSFCLGERRVGSGRASGNVRLMPLPGVADPRRGVGDRR